MNVLKIVSALAGLAVVGTVVAPLLPGRVDVPLIAQVRPGEEPRRPPDRPPRRALPGFGGGSYIGASVRDLDAAEAGRHAIAAGAMVEEVEADSPAARAGLKPSDIIVMFDGEQVRSVRQFSRLVQETVPGRAVTATILREGQRSDVQLTPSEDRGPDVFIDGDRLRERLGDLAARLPEFDFRIGAGPRGRLGVTVSRLTDQLAAYFGAREGVLVTAVVDGSAAGKAGVQAGDVITSINGGPVRSPQELTRALRDAARDGVTVGIVREKKEMSMEVVLEVPRP